MKDGRWLSSEKRASAEISKHFTSVTDEMCLRCCFILGAPRASQLTHQLEICTCFPAVDTNVWTGVCVGVYFWDWLSVSRRSSLVEGIRYSYIWNFRALGGEDARSHRHHCHHGRRHYHTVMCWKSRGQRKTAPAEQNNNHSLNSATLLQQIWLTWNEGQKNKLLSSGQTGLQWACCITGCIHDVSAYILLYNKLKKSYVSLNVSVFMKII